MDISVAISGKTPFFNICETKNMSQHNQHLIFLDDLLGRYQCTHKFMPTHFGALRRLPSRFRFILPMACQLWRLQGQSNLYQVFCQRQLLRWWLATI
jgi:hypothetical protein